MPDQPGRLVLVATPVGNLGDLSPRARATLAGATLICCEDTRRTGRLLAHAGIAGARLAVCNEHTERARVPEVLEVLGAGGDVAVVTDAGTPGISDPGERLVRAAVVAGHRIEVIPGPSAPVAALVASGLPTGRFCFEGFLPRRGSARGDRLATIAGERRTVVLFEAPHRLGATLADLAAALGSDRQVVVARELTKLHEELWRGPLSGAATWVDETAPKGEVVLVVAGAPEPGPAGDEELASALQACLDQGRSARDAAAEVARELGVPKRRAYALAITLR